MFRLLKKKKIRKIKKRNLLMIINDVGHLSPKEDKFLIKVNKLALETFDKKVYWQSNYYEIKEKITEVKR